MNHYDINLDKNNANHVPLTPLTFLQRAKDVYPDYEAIVYEDRSYTWNEVYKRVVKFASALSKIGIKKGDTVSFLAFNTPEIFEAHYSVPMTGAVLNTINIRLDANTINYILNHSDAKVLVVDRQLHVEVKKALKNLNKEITVIDINDKHADQSKLEKIGDLEYESFLNTGDENFDWKMPDDEWQAISLSYTSGTTGNPKGVVYHHRGAYLMSTGSSVAWSMPNRLNFLTVVPMFHCNGWCFPWTIAALAGKNICIRKVNSKSIFKLIKKHKVSHLCGTTVIINLLIKEGIKLKNRIEFMTGAAPPPSTVLKKIDDLGFNITHTYGLTEVYGPAVICEWQNDWGKLNKNKIAELKSYQGVRYPGISEINVFNKKTKKEVKHDGKELGEVLMRGNTVMMGYHKDILATNKAFTKGWFHTGDIAVIHKNGYIQLKDRSKDIIISGGENISSIEIENVLFKHKDIIDAAVVAKKDEKWGEVPCAFVTLKKNSTLKANEIIQFCRNNMASYKIPKNIIFGKIDKTPTGKTQKYLLRRKVNLID